MKIFNKIKKLIQKNQANLSDNQFFTNITDIMKWIDKYKISRYTINDDLSVDVDGDVDISRKNLKIIPVKFGKVNGDFYCNSNKLKSLKGSPILVAGAFWCDNNCLSNLIGSPKSVGGDFLCYDNKLTSLDGSPKSVGGDFWCVCNPLISLLEIINCDFKKYLYFSIDKNNFKQKEIIQIFGKYYNGEKEYYKLTNRQFQDTIKLQIEKEVLQDKLVNSRIKNKTKSSFI